jgi:transcriptional regulator with XRE-family HTH domain
MASTSSGPSTKQRTSQPDPREVVKCSVCELVQYRSDKPNNNACRRCLRRLPPKVTFVIPLADPQGLPGDGWQLFECGLDRESVANIGQRIRQLRESRGMTQTQLTARSRVSRSYLSRIESGQMTPSLGTLEKIAEPLGVGLNRFFVQESNGETVLEDPFIQGLRPFLRQLDWAQWQSILKRLQAISEYSATNGNPHHSPLSLRVPPAQSQMQRERPGYISALLPRSAALVSESVLTALKSKVLPSLPHIEQRQWGFCLRHLVSDFGVRITNVRNARGMSKSQLARWAKLSLPTIASMESGACRRPTFRTFQRLIAALQVNPQCFFTKRGPNLSPTFT